MCLCGRQLSQLLQIFYFLVIAIIIIKILMFRLHASLFRMRVTMLQFHSARLLQIEFFLSSELVIFGLSNLEWLFWKQKKIILPTYSSSSLICFFFYPQHVKCKNTKEFYNLADILKKDNILLPKNLIYLLIKNVTESVRNSDTFLDIWIYLYRFR